MKKEKVVRLDDEITGICPADDCEDASYPYGVRGLNGYVDACACHATLVWDDMVAAWEDELEEIS